MRAGLIAGFVTIILFTTGVVVAETSMSEQNVLKGREAFGGWHKHRPGVRRLLRLLKPEDQPPIGKSTSMWAESVKRSSERSPSHLKVSLWTSSLRVLQARVSSEWHPMATCS